MTRTTPVRPSVAGRLSGQLSECGGQQHVLEPVRRIRASVSPDRGSAIASRRAEWPWRPADGRARRLHPPPTEVFSVVITPDSVEDKCGSCDVADPAGAECDPLECAPAVFEFGGGAFAEGPYSRIRSRQGWADGRHGVTPTLPNTPGSPHPVRALHGRTWPTRPRRPKPSGGRLSTRVPGPALTPELRACIRSMRRLRRPTGSGHNSRCCWAGPRGYGLRHRQADAMFPFHAPKEAQKA